MQIAAYPEFVPLKVLKEIYGISPNALSQMKSRGEPTPFPLYKVQGIAGLAVRYREAKAYFDNLQPLTDAVA